jgi:2'-5' RNA ligase
MPRCFAAIPLMAPVRDRVADEIDRLRPLSRAVAWVPRQNLHLTLRFLGEQPEGQLPAVIEALGEAARGIEPFGLGLNGVGGFPGLERPRILWIGASEGALEARTLQARVEAALDVRGFGREARPWHPHVTIGRVFDERRWRRDAARDLCAAVTAAGGLQFGTTTVRSISLMRSDLSPAGARYSEIAAVPLGAR